MTNLKPFTEDSKFLKSFLKSLALAVLCKNTALKAHQRGCNVQKLPDKCEEKLWGIHTELRKLADFDGSLKPPAEAQEGILMACCVATTNLKNKETTVPSPSIAFKKMAGRKAAEAVAPSSPTAPKKKKKGLDTTPLLTHQYWVCVRAGFLQASSLPEEDGAVSTLEAEEEGEGDGANAHFSEGL